MATDIVSRFATGAGFMAAAIAVGGFLAHVQPFLRGRNDQAVRVATVVGGLGGLVFAAGLIAFELVA